MAHLRPGPLRQALGPRRGGPRRHGGAEALPPRGSAAGYGADQLVGIGVRYPGLDWFGMIWLVRLVCFVSVG